MNTKTLTAAIALGAASLAAGPALSQPAEMAVSADLSGRGATGTFSGTVSGDQLCYRLTTNNLPNARNPRLAHVSGHRVVRLLELERNVSDGCVRIGQQNARLIMRDPSTYFIYVGGANGARSLQGQLR